MDGWRPWCLCVRARERVRACVRLSASVCLGVLRKRICVQGVRCEACAMCDVRAAVIARASPFMRRSLCTSARPPRQALRT